MKDLVQIIKDNPGCEARIDNDSWTLFKAGYHDQSLNNQDDNWDDWELASSEDQLVQRKKGYGAGPCYGGDILQALAEVVGMKIESV
ncbi:MAG: hypothetical protein DWQ19_08760 [Crenarchaeota archaeon]|nr:MAG: hypothetical protein DWQ19_08760 [Thermoproteota archaeon]